MHCTASISEWRVSTPQYASLEALWQACLRGECKRLEPRRTAREESELWSRQLTGLRGISAPTTIFSTTKGDVGTWHQNPSKTMGDAANDARQLLEIPGECYVASAACASGLIALIDAAIRVSTGETIAVAGADIAGGFVTDGFSALKALAAETCRPFDSARDGLLLGSGAARCQLAPAKRGDIEIAGFGVRSDALHMTAPDRHATGLIAAIADALAMAQLPPDKIDAILAHGTGTRYNDAMEATAFRSIFSANKPAITAIKGTIGHTLGAASLIETAIACKVLEHQIIPPIAGLQSSEYTDLQLVTGEPLSRRVDTILKTASGFGGLNAAIILRKKSAGQPVSSKPASTALPGPPLAAAVDSQRNIRIIPATAAPFQSDAARQLPPLLAALAEMAHALLQDVPPDVRDRTSLILGTTQGSVAEDLLFEASRQSADGQFASPAAFARTLPTTLPAHLGLLLGIRGPTFIVSDAARSTALALDRAQAWLDHLQLPLVLAGGFDQHPDSSHAAALLALRPGTRLAIAADTLSALSDWIVATSRS